MEDGISPSEMEMPSVAIGSGSDDAQGRFSDLETGRKRWMVPITRLSSCSGAFRGKKHRKLGKLVSQTARISTPVTRADLRFSFSQIISMLSERIFSHFHNLFDLLLFFP